MLHVLSIEAKSPNRIGVAVAVVKPLPPLPRCHLNSCHQVPSASEKLVRGVARPPAHIVRLTHSGEVLALLYRLVRFVLLWLLLWLLLWRKENGIILESSPLKQALLELPLKRKPSFDRPVQREAECLVGFGCHKPVRMLWRVEDVREG
jgi:hypothetical protein